MGGKPYSLDSYPPFEDIFDRYFKQVLVFAGRQVSKSTTMSALMVLDSMRPHWQTLYVAPSQGQRNVYSNTRLGKLIRYSPKLMRVYMNDSLKCKDDVGHKMWSNGAEMHLWYADKDPDRIRGVSANKIYYDEVQDIDYDAVIPVVNETLSASPYGQRIFYGGTPKTMESAIHQIWEASTQSEWVMKCFGCNTYNIAGFKNVGVKGPICAKCGKPLNVRHGFWRDFNTSASEFDKIKGFRVPQIILPLHAESEEKWRELRNKLEGPNAYSESKAKNELFAMSDALGSRMISLQDLRDLCLEDHSVDRRDFKPEDYDSTFAGVDWSGEGDKHQSLTALWIWGFHRKTKKLRCVYYRAFTPGHPIQDVREIAQICSAYNCQFVSGDAGGGTHANALLREALGEHRVFGIRMGAISKQIVWDSINGNYNVDKTVVLDALFLAIKRKEFEFGSTAAMDPAFKHFLSEYEHITANGAGRRIWQRSASTPDDLLFAAVFAWISYKVSTGVTRFYV